MVATYSNLTTGSAAFTATPTTASVSPTSGNTVLLTFGARMAHADNPPSVTGNGLTWSLLDPTQARADWSEDGNEYSLFIFAANAEAETPSSGQISITLDNSSSTVAWSVTEVQDANNGDLVEQILAFVPGSNSTSITVTLPSPAQGSGTTAFGAFGNGGNGIWSPGVGFTSDSGSVGVGSTRIMSLNAPQGEQNIDATHTASLTQPVGIGVEVKDASTGLQIEPPTIGSGESVPNPEVQREGVFPDTIASAENVFSPDVQVPLQVSPNLISTGESVLSPEVTFFETPIRFINKTTGSGFGISQFNTASITPVLDDLLVLSVGAEIDAVDTLSVSGNSLTWDLVARVDNIDSGREHSLFVYTARVTTVDPGPVTLSFSSTALAAWSVDEATEVSVVSPIVQQQPEASASNVLTLDINLPSAPASNRNVVWGTFINDDNGVWTPGTGFTTDSGSVGTGRIRLMTEYNLSPQQNVDATHTAAFGNPTGLAIEFGAVSAGGQIQPDTISSGEDVPNPSIDLGPLFIGPFAPQINSDVNESFGPRDYSTYFSGTITGYEFLRTADDLPVSNGTLAIDSSGVISGTPNTLVSDQFVYIRATGPSGQAESNDFILNVGADGSPYFTDVNVPIPDQVYGVGQSVNSDVSGFFEGGAATSWTLNNISGPPLEVSINSSGVIVGTPVTEQVNTVSVRKSNASGDADSPTFTISVVQGIFPTLIPTGENVFEPSISAPIGSKIDVTHIHDFAGFGNSVYQTPSFTPSDKSLVVVTIVAEIGAAEAVTVTGNSITYSLADPSEGRLDWSDGGDDFSELVFIADSTGATEGAITITFEGNTLLVYSVDELSNVDLADPIEQITAVNPGLVETAISIDLPVAPTDTDNLVWGSMANGRFGVWTPGAGFQSVGSLGNNAPRLLNQWNDVIQQNIDATQNAVAATPVGIAIEWKADDTLIIRPDPIDSEEDVLDPSYVSPALLQILVDQIVSGEVVYNPVIPGDPQSVTVTSTIPTAESVLGPVFNETATYYVDPSRPNDTGDGLTPATAKQFIQSGIQLTTPGDTVILLDGTYPNIANNNISDLTLKANPGLPGAYTKLIGESLGGVIVEAAFDQVTGKPDVGYDLDPVYWHFENIEWRSRESKGIEVSNLDFFRCSFYGSEQSTNTPKIWAVSRSANHLYEECIFYGPGGRYGFQSFNFNNLVLRRCVIRADGGWDGASGQPQAPMIIYSTSEVRVINCIVVDAISTSGNGSPYFPCFSATMNDRQQNNDVQFIGCIAINNEDNRGFGQEGLSNPAIDLVLDQVVSLNNPAGVVFNAASDNLNFTIRDSLFGDHFTGSGIQCQTNGSSAVITGTILNNVSIGNNVLAYNESLPSNGSAISQDNNLGFNNPSNPNAFTTNVKTYDPELNGLLYPVRVESGSQLETDGIFTPVGANNKLIYKVGEDGARWDNPNKDVVTTEPLWPFPNEDWIRERFRTVTPEGSGIGETPDGQRGFAATGAISIDGSPQTLSKYIWEYFGNQIPDDVYGSVSPLTIPSGESVEVPTIETQLRVSPDIIGSGEVVPVPVVGGGGVAIVSDVISSGEVVFNPEIREGGFITPTTIPSAEFVRIPEVTVPSISNFLPIPANDDVVLIDTLSGTYNLQPGFERTVLIVVCDEQGASTGYSDINTITLGGVSATQISTDFISDVGDNFRNINTVFEIKEADLPADGNQSLVIVWDAGSEGVRKAYIWTLEGTDQSSSFVVTHDKVLSGTQVNVPYTSDPASTYVAVGNNGIPNTFSSIPAGTSQQNETVSSLGSGAAYVASIGEGLSSPPGVFTNLTSNRLIGTIIQTNTTSNQLISDPDLIESGEVVFEPRIVIIPTTLSPLVRSYVLRGTL